MKDNSLNQLGGTCSILAGVSYVAVGVAYMLMPVEQRPGGNTGPFLTSFAQNPTMLLLEYWAFAIGALVALGAVPAISDRVRSVSEGWVRWATNLAFVGFAVTAINFFRLLAILPNRAVAYYKGDSLEKLAIAMNQSALSLDPQGWLGFGAVGFWVLVVSVLTLRAGTLPKLLAYVGIGVAIAYMLVVAGYLFNADLLIAIAAGAGGIILGPIWYIWMGLRLRQGN
ncbi:MAG: DUF4386 domain-containing protein [Chloroflexi bacterium]|nr:DUF4386 domain-containing protein [Chloroflexota bacterium]